MDHIQRTRRPAGATGRTLLRLLPTPAGTPFTFVYVLVLIATSLFAQHADPHTVAALLRDSSTDMAHLARTPLLVLVSSALWIAGGLFSASAVGFLLVLTALERRIGALRTGVVFLTGHVVATLATELPVGVAVAAGRLPDSSLHRLDYGISFGLMAGVGALAGLLPPLFRWPLLAAVGTALVQALLAFGDPLTDWGHPLSLTIGLACWPLVRRWAAERDRARPAAALAEPAAPPGSAVPAVPPTVPAAPFALSLPATPSALSLPVAATGPAGGPGTSPDASPAASPGSDR
ncbi:rhomboid-like protein [Streptomyces sp. NPDC059398]|uniref:rhomboid-like protein n=1 Tax=Streptomyces sp. NPDC059398 TaxID=3346820 RepID=UPI00367A19E0